MSFYGLDQVVVPTAAFQKMARDILATHGQGRVLDPALSDAETPARTAALVASGALVVGAAISSVVAVFIFRHLRDEKDTFWKVVGYTGGISGILAALTLVMSSFATVTSTSGWAAVPGQK